MHGHIHVGVNQADEIPPELEPLFRDFLGEWRDTTQPLGEQIRDAVAAGDLSLSERNTLLVEIADITDEYDDELRGVFGATAVDAASEGRAATARAIEASIDFDVVPERTREELQEWAVTASQSVRDTMGEEVTNYLRGAVEEGATIEDIAEQFESEYMETRLHSSHAEQLARDSVVGAGQAGSESAIRDSSAIGKMWESARLEGRTREDHWDAHGQVVASGEAFDVGGASLRYPHDMRGPVEQTTNCLCNVRPVFEDELTDSQIETLRAGGTVWQ